MKPDPMIRRDKSTPNADMAHTLRVGMAAFVLLILPGLFWAEWQLMPTPQEKIRSWLHQQLAVIKERTDP